MRPLLLLALVLLAPSGPVGAARTFTNRCGGPVGLQVASRSGLLGFVQVSVIRGPRSQVGSGSQAKGEVHLIPLNRGPVPGPVRLADGDSVVFQVLTERFWAPGNFSLALDLFTFNAQRPRDEGEFRGEYLRLKYQQHPATGEELKGVRLAPADGSEEDVFHWFGFRHPEGSRGTKGGAPVSVCPGRTAPPRPWAPPICR
jgi:hypothetical protein